MADTSKATIAAVVERLKPSWAQDEEVTYAIAGSADDALRKIANGYIVSANGIRSEAVSLISALEAERDTLKQINANLMGDDENVPRYTTRRLKQEIARHMEAAEALTATLQAKLEKAAEALEPFSKAETDITSQLMLGNLAYSIVWPDDMPIGLLWDADDTDKALVSATWGDFRRARSTLSTLRETTE